MREKANKGIMRRTIGLFANIRIPWLLYVFAAGLEILQTKVALKYLPYYSAMQTAEFDSGVIGNYVLYTLIRMVVSIAYAIPTFYATAIVARNLQHKLINHSLRIPMNVYERNSSQMVSWIVNDCDYADGLISTLVGFVTSIVAVVMSVNAMNGITSALNWLIPIVCVMVVFCAWLSGRLMFLGRKAVRKGRAMLTAFMSEHLGFFTQIKQLHSKTYEAARGKVAIEGFYKAEVYNVILTFINGIVGNSVPVLISVATILTGVPMVRSGSMTITELATFQAFILTAYQSISSVPSVYSSVMMYNGELFYIAGLMDEPEEDYDQPMSMDVPDEDIRFEDVSFGYDEEEKVLDNVNFVIPKGKITAIVGPNGSGKTTLFKLLERFYIPQEGKISFGAEDAQVFKLKEWRQSFAYVLQEPRLIDGTIRENITYGLNREVKPEEIEVAARLANADEFINEFEEGYDYDIGDDGSHLSAGQKQRLAIARAIMLDPAYLLLDEATCNMDVISEKKVSEALGNMMKGRTTVMITHDMTALKQADNVIVLNGGSVEAEGKPEDVIKTSPTLKALVAAGEETENEI